MGKKPGDGDGCDENGKRKVFFIGRSHYVYSMFFLRKNQVFFKKFRLFVARLPNQLEWPVHFTLFLHFHDDENCPFPQQGKTLNSPALYFVIVPQVSRALLRLSSISTQHLRLKG